MPHTPAELGAAGREILAAGNTKEVGVANRCEGVVSEHGIDLCGALLGIIPVDAAGIDPDPLASVILSEDAAPTNLLIDAIARVLSRLGARLTCRLHIMEGLLKIAPAMR